MTDGQGHRLGNAQRRTTRTLFAGKTNDELHKTATEFAAAQERLAANTSEDFTHWHHISIRDLLLELAGRMTGGDQNDH